MLDSVGNLLASRLSGEDIEAGAFQDPPSYDDLPARLMFHSDEGAEKNALVRSGGQFFATDGGGQGDPRMPKFQVVISEPVAKMLEIPESAARNSLLLGGLATFVSGVIAGGFAFWITRPLAQIADTLREYRWNTPLEGLPSGLKDEIGDVARAFETLIERLTKSEMRARAIVESIHDALIVIDLNGRILEFSGMAEEMFDYRRAEVVGRSVAILMPEPYKSQYDQYLKRFRDTGEGEPLEKMREMQARRRNGEIFPIEFSFSSLGSGDSQTLVGTVRDITERKRAEEMKDGFISAVNHELRTPLTAINAALNLLDEHASSSFDEKSKRLMELALSGSSRLAKLVNDILDLRRIESGLLAHHAKCTDIKAAVADIVNRYGPLAERFQIAFRLDLAKRDITVFVDPGRFEQAMVHLLSNAAKYSPAGEQVTVRVREHEGEWVRISIIDKGPGIPENIRERIIESFSETEPENLVTEGRIGMGLRMAKSLVETFNGRISFWTELGAGTSFHIDLPILDAGEVGLADA